MWKVRFGIYLNLTYKITFSQTIVTSLVVAQRHYTRFSVLNYVDVGGAICEVGRVA